jgi:hypothetical protein
MGKTRLAQALLHLRASAYPQGVCWVELGGVSAPEALSGAVAAALGLQMPPGDAPGWFAFQAGDFELLQSPDRSMHLFFSKNDNTLYATAAGRGFTRGAPEAPPPVQGAQVPARLPITSPPNPES